MILALSDFVEKAWMVSLIAGAVVLVVVWWLLEWLRRVVVAVDEGVTAVWTMGKRVAQNTATTHTFVTTRARGVELLEELQRHAEPHERSGR